MPTILATLDDSDEAKSILPTVHALATSLKADVRLLMVVGPARASFGTSGRSETALGGALSSGTSEPRFAETVEQAIARQRDEATSFLEAAASGLKAAGINVRLEVVMADNVAQAIIKAASQPKPDLIAMATHGRSGLLASVLGSVSSEVVRSGVAPVVLIRPGSGA